MPLPCTHCCATPISELGVCIHTTYINTYIHTYVRTYVHIYIHTHRLKAQGFIQRGGRDLEFPPQEILKLSMVIVVLSQVLSNNLIPDYVRSNLRGSKFKIFLGGGDMSPDPLSRHTCLCVLSVLFATIDLLPSCSPLPLPTQNPVWNPDDWHLLHRRPCIMWQSLLVRIPDPLSHMWVGLGISLLAWTQKQLALSDNVNYARYHGSEQSVFPVCCL